MDYALVALAAVACIAITVFILRMLRK